MLIDSQELFSTAQAVTATGDTASTNVLDTGATQDEGIGEEVIVVAQVATSFTSAGSPTLQAVVQTSTDNSTWKDALIGRALTLNTDPLTAGTYLIRTRLPIGLSRYLRMVWRVGVTTFTAGAITSFLVKDMYAQQYGASGFSVS